MMRSGASRVRAERMYMSDVHWPGSTRGGRARSPISASTCGKSAYVSGCRRRIVSSFAAVTSRAEEALPFQVEHLHDANEIAYEHLVWKAVLGRLLDDPAVGRVLDHGNSADPTHPSK